MNTESTLHVLGQPVEVRRKNIKHLHLGVYPPDGAIRVSAPMRAKDDTIRLAVVTRLPWIRRRQRELRDQPRQTPREYVGGETHYVAGRPYRLFVSEIGPRERPSVRIIGQSRLELRVRSESALTDRDRVMQAWYRANLRDQLTSMITEWEKEAGVQAREWRIKRMRTRWGTCNPRARRIWLNLELAKKPPSCVEYIVVHELVHLMERRHNDAFTAHMDRLMPTWRARRDALNRAPLAHEHWNY